ncbi:hypothetical protein K469DRAFT_712654 [Zopfia rhizophila CBS 207.26]|uniref:Uncharacterized protein n=1 Tax=Zopfia rhizophila CBS 207.26 TaxID=1314779 RepID=A0A6A6ERB8_9PEZI|nr:hypothetical protein K469DRAFT_712654 [Zopfia rhizophila CBS 207.26]
MYAANLIQASRDVVNHYEKISEKMDATVLTREKHITKAWEQDVYNTARKLEVGHRKALKNVKKVLGMDDGQEEMNRVEKVDQGVEGDSEGDGEMPHTPVNYGLHNALRYTERGVKRMVKGLPKDASI